METKDLLQKAFDKNFKKYFINDFKEIKCPICESRVRSVENTVTDKDIQSVDLVYTCGFRLTYKENTSWHIYSGCNNAVQVGLIRSLVESKIDKPIEWNNTRFDDV